jgi:hypothetical protein
VAAFSATLATSSKMPLRIPTVTEVWSLADLLISASLNLADNQLQANLLAFHQTRFPSAPPPASLFREPPADSNSSSHLYHTQTDPYTGTLGPHQDEAELDLGTYPDGTPRTLTDDEIAIFRHSELETLLRAREKQREAAAAEAEAAAEEEAAERARQSRQGGDGSAGAGVNDDDDIATDWAGKVFGGRFPASFFESVDAMEEVETPEDGLGDGERRKKKRKKRAPRPGKAQREKEVKKEREDGDSGDVEEGPYGKRRVDKKDFEMDQGMTFRRLAREADEVGRNDEQVELDY